MADSKSTSAKGTTAEPTLGDYLSVGLAWLIPGAGHFAIGQKGRGLVFAITIHLLFFSGWLIGGVRAINPQDQAIWSYTQFMTGWPMMVANMVQQQVVKGAVPAPEQYAPKIADPGSVYCGIAGMLNLLVMFDVLVRIGGGRAEEKGAEKDAQTSPKPPNGGKKS